MSSIRSRSRSRSRRGASTTRARLVLGVVLALSVLVPAATSGAANDPRGANLVPETPGTQTDPAAPVIALTFDDGPNPTYTPQILDILKRYGVQATFFEVGKEAERHPDLVRRIVSEGHVIANHTWDHAHLAKLDDAQFSFQVDHTTDVLESISGQEVVCTRPPYGDANPGTVAKLAEHGQASVVWSADSRDFEKPGVGAIVQHALAGLRPGGIILFHDGGGDRTQTIAALPQVIEQIRARGYGFATACDRRDHKPRGSFDGVGSTEPETVVATGWASDPDTSDPIRIQVLIDGAVVQEVIAQEPRPDVAGPPNANHGFKVSVTTSQGEHEVCIRALNARLGDTNVDLGCKKVTAMATAWYDQLGRELGLLDQQGHFERPPVPPPAGDLIDRLVDRLLPHP